MKHQTTSTKDQTNSNDQIQAFHVRQLTPPTPRRWLSDCQLNEVPFIRFRFLLARRFAAGEEKTNVPRVPALAIIRRSTDAGSVEAGN